MKKEDKARIIEELTAVVKNYPHFYLVDTAGMNAEATSALRRKCFSENIKLVVVKNTLFQKALEKQDIDFSPLFDTLKGTTAVMFTDTANKPAKMLKDIKGGVPSLKAAFAEEGFYVGADRLEELVAIKSKNELIADVVAMLEGPTQGVISALESGANTIHGVLKTLEER